MPAPRTNHDKKGRKFSQHDVFAPDSSLSATKVELSSMPVRSGRFYRRNCEDSSGSIAISRELSALLIERTSTNAELENCSGGDSVCASWCNAKFFDSSLLCDRESSRAGLVNACFASRSVSSCICSGIVMKKRSGTRRPLSLQLLVVRSVQPLAGFAAETETAGALAGLAGRCVSRRITQPFRRQSTRQPDGDTVLVSPGNVPRKPAYRRQNPSARLGIRSTQDKEVVRKTILDGATIRRPHGRTAVARPNYPCRARRRPRTRKSSASPFATATMASPTMRRRPHRSQLFHRQRRCDRLRRRRRTVRIQPIREKHR